MFMRVDRMKPEVTIDADDKYGKDGFEVSMNEGNWQFDENHVLQSALCFINNMKTFLPVVWDQDGAYVENNGTRIYVLEYCG